MTPRFDLTRTPIPEGISLIEASAGTGKTYTIVGLVLRFLLEGRTTELGRLLVVTFTNAATEELTVRVRRGLTDAIRALETGGAEDPFLDHLAKTHGAAGLPPLRDALAAFDEVSIQTIHGFCQRVLVQSAFESGAPFDSELVADDRALTDMVARDFWRREVFPAATLEVALLRARKLSPETLAAALATVRRHPGAIVAPAAAALDDARAAATAAFDALAEAWPRSALPAVLREAKVRVAGGAPVIADKEAFLERVAAFVAGDVGRGLEAAGLCTTLGVRGALQKKWSDQLEGDPFCLACDALLGEAAVGLEHAHRGAFLAFAAERLDGAKRRANVLAFDDLLFRLDAALAEPTRDPALAEAVRGRYDAAFIDEFQDTDGVQYAIFRRLFRTCLLIGDPKQAIYAFRGADVFAYLRAKEDAEARFTLDRNFRSSAPMVAAVNGLFGRAARPFVFEGIPFEPAEAAGASARPRLEGDGRRPLVFWWASSPSNVSGAEALVHPALAREVIRLLDGPARLDGRPLEPGDLAVLVRTNAEARAVQALLGSAGVPSVVSLTGDVFASEEAGELHLLLEAVAEPRRSGAARAALTTRALGLDAAGAHALASDEDAFERFVSELEGYRAIWLESGFMPMIQSLVARRGVRQRLLGGEDGARRLTNLLHVAELAHGAEAEGHLGPRALVDWLAGERGRDHAGQEAAELRLETDDAAVRVVTVHKAKGLEYEVVFCPTLWHARPAGATPPLLAHTGPESLVVDFGSEALPERAALAEAERLAEDLRLAYVALTRARQRCYVAWGPIGRGVLSADAALAYLLHGDLGGPPGPTPAAHVEACLGRAREATEGWLDELRALVSASPEAMELELLEPAGVPRRRAPEAPRPAPLEARRARIGAAQLRPWQVSSFTSLVRTRGAPPAADEEARDHADPEASRAALETEAPLDGLHGFARGARAGSCLHAVLEALGPEGLTAAGREEVVAREIRRAGLERPEAHGRVRAGWEPRAATCEALDALAACRLPSSGIVVGAIRRDESLTEWQFHLGLGPVSPRDLAEVFAAHAAPRVRAEYAPRLAELGSRRVEGFLTGFVDLVCRAGGRFLVVDWKSNVLGRVARDYDGEAMWGAMVEHHYVLQYHLYLLALHRFLDGRLPGYDYDRDVGGAAYVFLRGLGAGASGVFEDRPPRALIEALDQRLRGEGAP